MSDRLLDSFALRVNFTPAPDCDVCGDAMSVRVEGSDRWAPCLACRCALCRAPDDGGCACDDDRDGGAW